MKNIGANHLVVINTNEFIDKIRSDCKIAMGIADQGGVGYENPLLAVYHYYKHGEEFAAVLQNNNIEVYLDKLPAKIIQDGNLTEIERVQNPDGTIFMRKSYTTSQNQLAVVIEGCNDRKISTMFRNSKNVYQDHLKKIANNTSMEH